MSNANKTGTLFNIERTRQLMNQLEKSGTRRSQSAALDLAKNQIKSMSNTPKFLTNQNAQKIISELQTENKGLRAQLAASRTLAAKNRKPTASSQVAKAACKGWSPPEVPTISREAFRALSGRQKQAFLKAEGKII